MTERPHLHRHHMTGRRRMARTRRRNTRAALMAVALLAIAFYVAFVKQVPFSSRFVVRAVFSSANQLKPGNPVRIAGLPAGTVTSVGPGPAHTALVTMALTEHAGVHTDATMSIQPRLLFEGNFYVALVPGSPGAPPLRSGDTIPLTHTSAPVQLDQLLDVLDSPTRASLTQTFSAFGTGLGAAPGSRSAPGYAQLRRAARELAAALPPVAQVAGALQGTHPGDLSRAINSSGEVTAELAGDPAALADLVTSSDQVLRALATGQNALGRDIVALDRLTQVAPSSLHALDVALPVLTQFAGALRPTLRAAPGALTDTNRLFEQLQGLGGARELPALVGALGPLVQTAPGLEARLGAMFPRLAAVNWCTAQRIVPALDTAVSDGANTSGYPAWKDLLHLGAALSGASASFDGNGVALRIGVAEGDQSGSGLIPGFGQLFGKYQGEGVRPTWLGYGVVPPFRPDQTCTRQPLAKVNR